MAKKPEELQQVLHYTFKNPALLRIALTHTSFANESKVATTHNERLEFLGDSVLSVVVADYLFHQSGRPEGELTRMRASLVSEDALFQFAQEIHLGEYLRLGHGEDLGGGRNRPSVGLFLYKGPASRSPALCAFLLAVLLVCAKSVGARKGCKLAAGLCAAMVPVVGAISYILPLFVVKIGPWADEIGPAWLAKLDSLLTCRISLAWAAYRVFDIKVAGQMLMDWPAIDNIFVYFLYQFGPVLVVLAGILMAVTLYRLARHGRWQAAACLLVVLFYGYMETQVIHITSNPALLLLVPAVFGDSLSD